MKIEDYFVIHCFHRLFVLYTVLYLGSNPICHCLQNYRNVGPLRDLRLRRIGTRFYTLLHDGLGSGTELGTPCGLCRRELGRSCWIILASMASNNTFSYAVREDYLLVYIGILNLYIKRIK